MSLVEKLEQRRFLDAGELDRYFNDGQPVFADLDGEVEVADVAVDHNGRIVVCGLYRPDEPDPAALTDRFMFLARFLGNGALDTNFADAGYYINTPLGRKRANRISMFPNGSFAILADPGAFDEQRMANTIIRFRANGRIQDGYGLRGFGAERTVDPQTRFALAPDDLLALPDGKLLVVGESFEFEVPGSLGATVWKYDAVGKPDPSFATEGRFAFPSAAPHLRAWFDAVAVDEQGRIYLGANHGEFDERPDDQNPGRSLDDTRLAVRLTPDGQLDMTYGQVGFVESPTPGGDFASRSIALAPDGSAAVRFERLSGEQGVFRISPDGNEIRTVEIDDLGLSGFTPADPEFSRVVQQADGKVLVPGENHQLLRLRANLTLDTSFGDNGVAQLAPSGGGETYLAVAHDGSIVAAADAPAASAGADDPSRRVAVGRFWSGDGPAATLVAQRPQPGSSRSWLFQITYRTDDDAEDVVDTSTFDDRDVRITGPNGFVRYAAFSTSVPHGDDRIRARYKISPPGGTWDAADNGEYVVRLVGRQVTDLGGRFAAGTVLGRFELEL